ncbi:hypothetical protein HNQ71_003777 [Mesorhizobium sangaii]|uniref:Uncharacterized protein n=2 Tax=Mesorhizobium sangaii TaxID=505389 RepID=A0A841PC31_9HYPH|nr:hypothetical protein [Mesorhizobium sangaii]
MRAMLPFMTATPESIEQVDAVLAEDGRTVILYGHTADENVTFAASIVLPMKVDDASFLKDEWRTLPNLEWHLR